MNLSTFKGTVRQRAHARTHLTIMPGGGYKPPTVMPITLPRTYPVAWFTKAVLSRERRKMGGRTAEWRGGCCHEGASLYARGRILARRIPVDGRVGVRTMASPLRTSPFRLDERNGPVVVGLRQPGISCRLGSRRGVTPSGNGADRRVAAGERATRQRTVRAREEVEMTFRRGSPECRQENV
jgi:hypothetical protein